MSALPPIVVFDLDGTLADTAPDLVATLNVVLAAEDLPPLPLATARDLIGAGARALIERGFAASGRELLPARLDALFHTFMAHYEANLCVHSRLYPGVEACLDRLDAAGFRLAVCTNKFEGQSVGVLRALGIADRFGAICGRDTFRWFKPDPRHLQLTIERAGGDPRRAVMVGDSRTDVATAKAAGLPVIAVPFGYTDVPVVDLDPDRIVTHFDALDGAVQDFLGQGSSERGFSARRFGRDGLRPVVGATGIEPVTLRV
jgi:phosphoglycolate phosphatase